MLEQVGPLIGLDLSVEYKSIIVAPVVQPLKSHAWVGAAATAVHEDWPAAEYCPVKQLVQLVVPDEA